MIRGISDSALRAPLQDAILRFLDRIWPEDWEPASYLPPAGPRTPGGYGRFDGVQAMSSIIAINAKNQFRGRVKQLISGPVVSEVLIDTAAGSISSVITTSSARELNLQAGVPVLALFKATEVSIAKLASASGQPADDSSIRLPDRFRGEVKSITPGPVVSEVEVEVPGGTVAAVITTSSLEDLELTPGSEVLAIVKSTEVAVARLHDSSTGYSPYLD